MKKQQEIESSQKKRSHSEDKGAFQMKEDDDQFLDYDEE